MRRSILGAVLAVLAAATVACGSSGDGDDATTAGAVDPRFIPQIETAVGPAIGRQMGAALGDARFQVTSFACETGARGLDCLARAVSRGRRGTIRLEVRVDPRTGEVSADYAELSIPAWGRAINTAARG